MYIWLAAICTIFPPFLEIYLSTYESRVAFLKLAFGYKKKEAQKLAEFNELRKIVLFKFICFFQIIRFFIIYNFFYPRLFQVQTCVPCVQVVYALRPCFFFFLSDRFITLSGKLLKPFLLSPRSYSECKPKSFGGRSINYCQILQPERAPGPVS